MANKYCIVLYCLGVDSVNIRVTLVFTFLFYLSLDKLNSRAGDINGLLSRVNMHEGLKAETSCSNILLPTNKPT